MHRAPIILIGLVYTFNGRHLGWIASGIVRDHNGDGVGFTYGSVNVQTQFEPFKGLKQWKSWKSWKYPEPNKPLFTDRWSSIPLEVFLAPEQ
jgi:hypothetical protein